MKISIAICTWNRCHLLRQTLQHLARLTIPDGVDLEIVIVDNHSTDGTRQVIESFADQLPVRYVFEKQQGHCASRNAAVAHARGDYIIWTDNDVIVDPHWLAAYADGFSRHRQAGFFGGKILPVFASGKPQWLAQTWEKCKAVYAARDLGDHEIELGNGVFPYGANFAVRTDVQKEFLFDPRHGRNARGMLGEDEISVLRRIAAAGYRGFWLPAATLQHFIPDERATPGYVSRYFAGQGQMNILQGKVRRSAQSALVDFLRHQLAFRLKRRISPADEWVSHLIRASLSRGEYQAIRQCGDADEVPHPPDPCQTEVP